MRIARKYNFLKRRVLARAFAFVSIEKGKYSTKGNLKPEFRPNNSKFYGFDHLKYYCSNAKQAAQHYTSRFGFEFYAYSGLETGVRDVSTHVIKKGDVVLVFESPLYPDNTEYGDYVTKHGENIKDIAFEVEDVDIIYRNAVSRGIQGLKDPEILEDENGFVKIATLAGFDDTVHTIIERNNFNGIYLPGFQAHPRTEILNELFDDFELSKIDHVGIPQPCGGLDPVEADYYKGWDFHHFWSVDEKVAKSDLSSLKSTVIADYDENIKMPIFEPTPGIKKSQIQEFIEHNGGPGAQHVALETPDIIQAVSTLKKRGVEFLPSPSTYYDILKEKFKEYNFSIKEDLETLNSLDILVDFDENGYLLQIFTKPQQDRPTLFYEFIQRESHDGFGVGNFTRLFLAIEREQKLRGNLV